VAFASGLSGHSRALYQVAYSFSIVVLQKRPPDIGQVVFEVLFLLRAQLVLKQSIASAPHLSEAAVWLLFRHLPRRPTKNPTHRK
jgi:hypothetical protein